MEQQTISIAAGITTVLNSRAAVLGGGEPGRDAVSVFFLFWFGFFRVVASRFFFSRAREVPVTTAAKRLQCHPRFASDAENASTFALERNRGLLSFFLSRRDIFHTALCLVSSRVDDRLTR